MPIDKYLEYWDAIFQCEPIFFMDDSEINGLSGVTSIIYRDIPEKGMITAVTYGLSLVKHSDWKLGHPELMITIKSEKIAWGRVVGFLANRLRGKCPFSYGNTINFKEKIAADSKMDAFLVFAPSIIDKKDYLNIDVGLDYRINIKGLYPIYSTEMDLVANWGLEKFWHHPDFEMYNVNRKRIRR